MRGCGERAIRVLAADDSAVMRGVLRTVFQLHAAAADRMLPRMELVDVVRDGVEALAAVRRLRPDVLLLDLEMPLLNGLEVLRRLQVEAPTLPVIMCSALTERGAKATLDALSFGAKDYVMKPGQGNDFAAALDTLMEQLLPKIAALANAAADTRETGEQHLGEVRRFQGEISSEMSGEGRRPGRGEQPAAESGATTAISGAGTCAARVELIVIGVSTGGPSALEVVLPRLRRDLPVPVMIVQHMPRLFTQPLVDRLNRLCALEVKQAVDGMPVRPGTILLAPGDAHLEVRDLFPSTGGRALTVRLHHGPPLNSCMPSADYLFRSAARVCGAGALGVIMTGMGSDGFEGARALRQAGATVIAQDEASSAVWGMPGRVVRAGLASATISLGTLAETIAAQLEVPETQALPARSELLGAGLARGGEMVFHGLL